MILKEYVIAIMWTYYCICDMICDIRGNNPFYINLLICFEKYITVIMVFFLGSMLNKDAFLHLQSTVCRPGQLCSITIFELKVILTRTILFNQYRAFLRFKNCSRLYCDFDEVSINCATLFEISKS